MDESLYNELTLYTLLKRDPEFIHQEVVDAWAAQTADENSKPIKIAFALIGLYLYLEKGCTGREVQLAHMRLAKDGRKEWPYFKLPEHRGSITAADVLRAPAGPERDAAIKD